MEINKLQNHVKETLFLEFVVIRRAEHIKLQNDTRIISKFLIFPSSKEQSRIMQQTT